MSEDAIGRRPPAHPVTAPLSLIVINFGSHQLVANLLSSLREHADRTLMREVIVVDNGYPDMGDARTVVRGERYPFPIRFVQNSERSYASGINRGAEVSVGEYVTVVNNDVQWLPEWSIAPVLHAMTADPCVGIAGLQLVFPDGSWQRSYGRFPSLSEGLRTALFMDVLLNALAAVRHRLGLGRRRPKRVDYVDGAFMLIRRQCLRSLGGFDERFRFYGEDPDFCWRAAEAGWTSLFVPSTRLMHMRGASSTNVAAGEFALKKLQAKLAVVDRHFGRRHADLYARLQRWTAREFALVYNAIARLVPTQAWRRRARLAAAAARSAKHLGASETAATTTL